MRTLMRRAALGALFSTLFALGACEELVAPITPENNTPATGTVTFWTSDPSPSPIAVRLNGNTVGTLTMYRTSAPACGAGAADGALSVSVAAGSHVVSAFETEDSGTWPPTNITVRGGECMTFHFRP